MGLGKSLLGALPVIGDVASAWMASESQSDANRTNVRLARENRKWQEDMANTAYQRKRRDLEAAGYNPMLGVEGMGSATPNINAPTVESTGRQAADIMNNSANKVMQNRMMQQQLLSASAQTHKMTEEARLAAAQTDLTIANTGLIPGTAAKMAAETANLESVGAKVRQEIENLVTEKQLKDIEASIAFYTQSGKIDQINATALLEMLKIPKAQNWNALHQGIQTAIDYAKTLPSRWETFRRNVPKEYR